ncbi:hypothetical protein NP233_g7348 [Leucocoprinus birnbaumii]|uniref:F-box domain-containing protein n=1 Tax=Leucocoprinus birnbaumii TaxID=56174 RepID=A0AAD5VSP9_9AGAR|nr:hypothetical protein NP233_g7348 [Leucocoprinus birnbaumii]
MASTSSTTASDISLQLPPEVLATIISFAAKLEPLCRGGWLTTLGGVCLRWRAIIWSCPFIWTTFSCSALCANPHILDILRLHLANSGTLCLDVVISGQTPLAILLPLCRDIFFEYSSRIRSFEILDSRSWVWEAIEMNVNSSVLSRLERLRLGIEMYTQWRLPNQNDTWWNTHFPRLCSIELYRPHFRMWEVLPLGQLTELWLTDVYADYAICTLSQCPNLSIFACDESPRIPNTYPEFWPRSSIHAPIIATDIALSRLTTFHWRSETDRFMDMRDGSGLKHLRLPNVRRLEWCMRVAVPDDWRESWMVCMPRMTNLEVIDIHTNLHGMIPDLLLMFAERALKEVKIHVPRLPELRACLRTLTADHRNNNDLALGSTSFPRLERLTISFGLRIIKLVHVTEMFEAIVKMIASRRRTVMLNSEPFARLHQVQLVGQKFIRSLSKLTDVPDVSERLKERLIGASESVYLSGVDMDMIVEETQST